MTDPKAIHWYQSSLGSDYRPTISAQCSHCALRALGAASALMLQNYDVLRPLYICPPYDDRKRAQAPTLVRPSRLQPLARWVLSGVISPGSSVPPGALSGLAGAPDVGGLPLLEPLLLGLSRVASESALEHVESQQAHMHLTHYAGLQLQPSSGVTVGGGRAPSAMDTATLALAGQLSRWHMERAAAAAAAKGADGGSEAAWWSTGSLLAPGELPEPTRDLLVWAAASLSPAAAGPHSGSALVWARCVAALDALPPDGRCGRSSGVSEGRLFLQQLAACLDAGTGGSLLESQVQPGPTLQDVFHSPRPEMAQQDGSQHPGSQEGAACSTVTQSPTGLQPHSVAQPPPVVQSHTGLQLHSVAQPPPVVQSPTGVQPPQSVDWLDAFAVARAVRLCLENDAGSMPLPAAAVHEPAVATLVAGRMPPPAFGSRSGQAAATLGAGLMPTPAFDSRSGPVATKFGAGLIPSAAAADLQPAVAALGALHRWLASAATRLPALPAVADGAGHVQGVGVAKEEEEERSVLRVAVQILHAHGAVVRRCNAAVQELEVVQGVEPVPGRSLAGSADVTQHEQAAIAAAAGGAEIWALFGRRLLGRLHRDPRSALSSAHLASALAPLQQLVGGRQPLIAKGLSEIRRHLRHLVAGAPGADVWLKQAAGGQGGWVGRAGWGHPALICG